MKSTKRSHSQRSPSISPKGPRPANERMGTSNRVASNRKSNTRPTPAPRTAVGTGHKPSRAHPSATQGSKSNRKQSATRAQTSPRTQPATRAQTSPRAQPATRAQTSPRAQPATRTQSLRPQREFHVWGRRPIENYLARLQQEETVDQKSHALHVIADKTGRVPAQLKNIVEPCKAMGFKITLCKSQEDETWPLNSEEQLNHQRVCLKVPQIPTVSIHDVVQNLPDWIADSPHGCLGLVLDQVQDPRNFGAIIRTAAFFGAKFVVFGEDRQAEITPLVVKASSGGAFSLQLVPTVNINRAIEMLKKSGVWVVGSSLQATARHNELPVDRHYVLVVGNEAKGMRQEVARHCDYLVKIPGGAAAVDSLNVAVATGVLMSALQSEIEASVSPEFGAEDDFEE